LPPIITGLYDATVEVRHWAGLLERRRSGFAIEARLIFHYLDLISSGFCRVAASLEESLNVEYLAQRSLPSCRGAGGVS
jgi:hypothetical protein